MKRSPLYRYLTLVLGIGCPACGGADAPGEPVGHATDTPTQAAHATVSTSDQHSARFLREIQWAKSGVWLKADTHAHTKFSDGASSVAELAAKAREFGCDVLAITDHSDVETEVASDTYWSAIQASREENPELVILGGLEWDAPPYQGDEHVVVLAHPDAESRLTEFRQQFAGPGYSKLGMKDAQVAFRWLEDNARAPMTEDAQPGVLAIAIYSHPSRKDSRSLDNVDDMNAWRKGSETLIGFGGAPGHQRDQDTGSYKYELRTVDRWDPVVEIGGAWDALLQGGHDIWAALAPSDHHNANYRELLDPWPGEFSETWIFAPDGSARGVLRGLRAGSFFAVHGHIAREVVFSVEAPGLPRPAFAGEAIELEAGAELRIRLELEIPATDWQGEPNRVDEIEFIAIDRNGARSLASHQTPFSSDGVTETISLDDGDLVLRARGRRVVDDGPDLMFYTNPIRIRRKG